MVASVRKRRRTGRAHDTGSCVPINDILADTPTREGLVNSIPLLIRQGRNLDRDTVHVREGVRVVFYDVTGCIPEHAHESNVAEAVVFECPKDPEDRCDNCILKAGENAIAAYEAVVIRSC
jgi:hypothetical protein